MHRSPDRQYDLKWRAILCAYNLAVAESDICRLAWFDEMTYLRIPVLKNAIQRAGQKNEAVALPLRANTQTRIAGALDTLNGQVTAIQRSAITVSVLKDFIANWADGMYAQWPRLQHLYLAMDNWPVHHHPDVLLAAQQAGVTPLFLPTYASWLNPIEKLWRWLRQEVVHSHPHVNDLPRLRTDVSDWLALRSVPDPYTLYRTGLLSHAELAEIRAQAPP